MKRALLLVIWLFPAALGFAQRVGEEPLSTMFGPTVAIDLYRGPSGSIHWVAVAETLVGRQFESEMYRRHLYYRSRSSSGIYSRPIKLEPDSLMRFVDLDHGQYDMLAASLAMSPGTQVAVAWTRQPYMFSDIAYPLIFGKPELRCGLVSADSCKILLKASSADHPSIAFDDQNRIHLAYEAVTQAPPGDSSLYGRKSYYYTRSDICYGVLSLPGGYDSLAVMKRGFRPQLHRDKSGGLHLFWLAGDSSTSPTFRLMYIKNPGMPGASSSVVYAAVPGLNPAGLERFRSLPSYRSFVDDAGRPYAAWTDAGTESGYGLRISFARLTAPGIWQIDTLGNLSQSYSAVTCAVAPSGRSFVLWSTNMGANTAALHFSTSPAEGRLFTQDRIFQSSAASYGGMGTIIIDSRGKAGVIFGDASWKIDYLRDLESGPDSVIEVASGSISFAGVEQPHALRATGRSVVVDSTDQIWLVRSASGLTLLGIDRTITGLPVGLDHRRGAYRLYQNYPNPFNPSTTIRYSLPRRSHVTLTVFNALGQQVTMLVDREMEAGYHEVAFEGSHLASGVYLCRLQAAGYRDVKKLLLIR